MHLEKYDARQLPQLIVALDSLDDKSNYIHIRDVNENTTYYCPCCKKEVNPRAWRKDNIYQEQPHFYHINGSCNKEEMANWLYKNWLFSSGSKFVVNGKTYTVVSSEPNLKYSTSYGDYIPSITVNTDCGTMLFEINFNNDGSEDNYFGKWNELGFDVVEVDMKNFMASCVIKDIPEFDLIYSNGVCYKYWKKDKSLCKVEYYKRSQEIEMNRQEKLDYKSRWMKLDWFWIELQKYLSLKKNGKEICKTFDNLDFEDKDFAIKTIHSHKIEEIECHCIKDIDTQFKNILNDNKNRIIQISPKIYYIIHDYKGINIASQLKVSYDPSFHKYTFLNDINKNILELLPTLNNLDNIVDNFDNIQNRFKNILTKNRILMLNNYLIIIQENNSIEQTINEISYYKDVINEESDIKKRMKCRFDYYDILISDKKYNYKIPWIYNMDTIDSPYYFKNMIIKYCKKYGEINRKKYAQKRENHPSEYNYDKYNSDINGYIDNLLDKINLSKAWSYKKDSGYIYVGIRNGNPKLHYFKFPTNISYDYCTYFGKEILKINPDLNIIFQNIKKYFEKEMNKIVDYINHNDGCHSCVRHIFVLEGADNGK